MGEIAVLAICEYYANKGSREDVLATRATGAKGTFFQITPCRRVCSRRNCIIRGIGRDPRTTFADANLTVTRCVARINRARLRGTERERDIKKGEKKRWEIHIFLRKRDTQMSGEAWRGGTRRDRGESRLIEMALPAVLTLYVCVCVCRRLVFDSCQGESRLRDGIDFSWARTLSREILNVCRH